MDEAEAYTLYKQVVEGLPEDAYRIALNNSTHFNEYMTAIKGITLLTVEQEQALLSLKEQEPDIENILVATNIPLVVDIAKTYFYMDEKMDIIQVGTMGLIRAIRRFDVSKGFKLSTYATYWIHQAIKSYLDRQSHMIKIPSNKIEKLSKTRKIKRTLTKSLGREPTIEEISEAYGKPPKYVAAILNVRAEIVSYDKEIYEGSEGCTILDTLEDTNLDSFIEVVARKELRTTLEKLLNDVDECSQLCIKLYYGFICRSMTLKEVGDRLGISHRRVNKNIKKGLAYLSKGKRGKILKEFL